VFTLVGAHFGGAVGFAAGFACAEAAAAIIWWRGFGLSLRDLERKAAPRDPEARPGTSADTVGDTGETPAIDDEGDLPFPTVAADLAS
jgi:hypothetical protein